MLSDTTDPHHPIFILGRLSFPKWEACGVLPPTLQ